MTEKLPVYDHHYSDHDGADPIGYAETAAEADNLLLAHFAPMSPPPLSPMSPHDRDWKGTQVWGWWTASATEAGENAP